MSEPKTPEPARLFLSAIYRDAAAFQMCLERLSGWWGPADTATRELPFSGDGYYGREMGAPLWRRYVTFRRLVDPERLVDLKLATNRLEDEAAADGRRRVNLDPGLLSLNHLTLASGKPVPHRPYLSRGIYVDLTLVYESGTYRALPWTYPDYAAPGMIGYLNRLRAGLRGDLVTWRKTAPLDAPGTQP